MKVELEEQIKGEICRRAVKRSYFEQWEREKHLFTQDTIAALRELTDLKTEELEEIAREVRRSFVHMGEGFFSIKYQIFFVGLFTLIFLCIAILTLRLL